MVRDENRIAGAIMGLLIGDALGVPYEFHASSEIPSRRFIDYTPPGGFARAHPGVPPGTWSDDGAQALCLLASLLHCGKLDADDFALRLIKWRDEGYMALDGIVFDIGITTNRALNNIRHGVSPIEAGPSSEYDNGNGSLMRVLPLALWHRGTDKELVRDARLQSRITHGHVRAQLCCALYCLWTRRVWENKLSPWDEAVTALREILGDDTAASDELEATILNYKDGDCTGSGYVADCLTSARKVMRLQTYEDVVLSAIALGNDTDTTACVAGGIAGLRGGLDQIPLRWREDLRGREIAEKLIEGLGVKLFGSNTPKGNQ